ncbi:Right handed beta helix region [Allosphingosinicella indica]|uniref:Right handed beta helix region n=2 Tax=Allosphingosinicella indica TaxID=941907 RepID=A0A1X7G168_9SPHN|nr:Right handed beta helix region [Allosphingosinicella indica]
MTDMTSIKPGRWDVTRRGFIRAAGAVLVTACGNERATAEQAAAYTPEGFGAKGDGRTNDTAAFQALSAAINARSGGTVMLRKGAVYIVGGSKPADPKRSGGYTFTPADILRFTDCRNAVVVHGNGATLRAVDGYRFGTFSSDGAPTRNALPYYGPQIAAGYSAMIFVEGCSGSVLIENLELDGNVGRARIGGPWGDAGYQLPGSGLQFRNNSGRWRVVNVRAHHHPLDGIHVNDPGDATTPPSGSGTEGCDFDQNGRQGLSLVGGVGHIFRTSKFRRTRRDGVPVQSAPGAGVDLEAEGGRVVRDIRFERCEMSDNVGVAFLHGGGPVSNITVVDSLLLGTTTWSYYSSGAKSVRFVRTRIVGAVVNLIGGEQGEVFEDCLLTNDPAEAPRGQTPFSPSGFIIQDAVRGVRFIRGEIRNGQPVSSRNGNLDQMTLEGTTIRATAGSLIVYGRCSKGCRFVEDGGTIGGLPGGADGKVTIGQAEDGWSLVRRGRTTRFPATVRR